LLVWPILVLALLLIFNFFFTPGFFHLTVRDGRVYGSLIDILRRGAPVMLLSLGMALVIATGGIDLSVGAVMAITGTIAAALIVRPDDSPLAFINVTHSLTLIILLSLAAAAIAGLWNGLLVALLDIQPIVATLILMVAGRGIARFPTSGQIVTFEHPGFEFLGTGGFLGLPFPVTIVVVVAILTGLLTRGTALGLFVESVGNNPKAARLAGVSSSRVKILVYVFCGFCAGVAGLISTADIKAADFNNLGLYLELDAILAVSLGGTSLSGGRFSIVGALIGAVLIQTLTTTILARGVPEPLTLVIKGMVVVLVCLLQSEKFRSRCKRLFKRGNS
jgi:simple sugar transport system permease protein